MSNRIPGAAYVYEREARSTISLVAINEQQAAITDQQVARKDLQLKSGELKLASNRLRGAIHIMQASSREK